ncbi:MAG: lysine 2,3-aminomutase, partial [Rhodospirillaceae bacterium]
MALPNGTRNIARKTLRRGRDLAAAGLIAPEAADRADAVAARYSVAIPPALADLIDAADPADPLARQFVPDPSELDDGADELDDPIGDAPHSPVKGLVHRYPDRVLLMPTLSCPVYCRFCFRRDRVGRAADMPSPADIDAALAYIAGRPGIREV